MYKVINWIVNSDLLLVINSISHEERRIGRHDSFVLNILCDNAGKIVTKETLLNNAWPGKHVSEGSLTQAISNIRHLIEDNGKEQKYLKTISKVGYKLECAAVSIIEEQRDDNSYKSLPTASSINNETTFTRSEHDSTTNDRKNNASAPLWQLMLMRERLKLFAGCTCIFIAILFLYIANKSDSKFESIVPNKVFDSPSLTLFWDDEEEGNALAQQLKPFISKIKTETSMKRLVLAHSKNAVSIIIISSLLEPVNIVLLLREQDNIDVICQLVKNKVEQYGN